MPDPTVPTIPARRERNLRVLAAAALIVAAGFLSYFRSVDAPFVFDDIPGVVENESIRDLSALDRVLRPPAAGAGIDSRPVVNLSLALNYATGALNPRGYHLTNIALHVCCALALFGLVRRTLLLPSMPAWFHRRALPVAFCTALLWTVHPLQSETVICIIQRTEALVSLWYLLTLYAFVRAAAPGGASWLAALGVDRLSAGHGLQGGDGVRSVDHAPL